MHKKFEINQTKIKGGCQSGRKVLPNDSKSDLPLETSKKNPREHHAVQSSVHCLVQEIVANILLIRIELKQRKLLLVFSCTWSY